MRSLEQSPEEFLKKIEEELIRYQNLHGFHFMDKLIDEIKEYNKK